jgi:octaprenyl-diphosphate synthase
MVSWSRLNPIAQKPSPALLAQMFEPIREDLEKVEQEFVRHLESQVALIPTIGHYIQQGGGKRIRPAVLLMAARMSGYTGEHGALFASVIEFIHTATLVHGDIIDKSDLLRTGGTLALGQRRHSSTSATSSTSSRCRYADARQSDFIRLSARSRCMIESLPAHQNGVVDLSEDERFEIIRRKIAYLFAAARASAACWVPAPIRSRSALWDASLNIGQPSAGRRSPDYRQEDALQNWEAICGRKDDPARDSPAGQR